jgi:protein subunit release factor A
MIPYSKNYVRVTHLPTGLTGSCDVYRSQHQNKAAAMKQLYSKLYSLSLSNNKQEFIYELDEPYLAGRVVTTPVS